MIFHRGRLIVGAVSVFWIVQTIGAQAPSPDALHTITGVITDASGNAMEGVEVMLVRDSSSTVAKSLAKSRADGSVIFENIPGGPVYMRIRRLGFRLVVLQIKPDTLSGRKPFRVALQPAPVELASVEVAARSTQAMKDFDERRRKRGTGRFIDRAEILRLRPAFTSDMLHSFPGMSVRPGRMGNSVRVRGCRPSVWIDGVQAQGAELDEVTRPSDVEGIEIYSSWSGVPPQFADRSGRSCGAILVWTRIR